MYQRAVGAGVFFRRLRVAATGAILAFSGTSASASFAASSASASASAASSVPSASGASRSASSSAISSSSSPMGATSTDAPRTVGSGATVLGLGAAADHSWMRQLTPDPETQRHVPNRSSRQVKSGHYVRVAPTALKKPKLVIHSPAMAASLGIAEEDVLSDPFAAFFSGDAGAVPGMETWATPYALSIMGKRQTSNCPFNNGNGYGDGRAISVGEVVVSGKRWELQLKGGGPTPFCRGADGRAVLRSSIREFLASEAMHALNISTTRALSLVMSQGNDVARRPWYNPENNPEVQQISMDDPRLARFPEEVRKQIIRQAATQMRDPDMMVVETCAITTRVAPSFTRIGHVDLFSRRASKAGKGTPEHKELEMMVNHAIFREFPDILDAHPAAGGAGGVSPAAAAAFLRRSGGAINEMVTGWLRVGFCQGNFNADNCLVGGRTMDYGPFGWMDEYDPMFAKWVGSGEHFAFMNQPGAGLANFGVLASSVAPLLTGGENEASRIVAELSSDMEAAVADTWRKKLGFPAGDKKAVTAAASLFDGELEPLMRASNVDYTLMWRQLAVVAELPEGASDAELLAPLRDAFYVAPAAGEAEKWGAFLRRWREAIKADRAGAAARIKSENPKYVLREWMLVEAYTAAKERNDFGMVHELFALTVAPYEEGTAEQSDKYYRRAPDAALRAGGTAFMS